MSTAKSSICICCGSNQQIESTTLTDANGKKTSVSCCEQCFSTGKIFHREQWVKPSYPCPMCEASTNWQLDCPGYPVTTNNKTQVMVCYPYCGNAIRFECNVCSWWHRAPNNRDTDKMGICPDWLGKALAEIWELEE